jgi:hypothetical protein
MSACILQNKDVEQSCGSGQVPLTEAKLKVSKHSREILNNQIDYKLVSFQNDSHHDLETLLVYMSKLTFRSNVQPQYSNMTELHPGRRRSV